MKNRLFILDSNNNISDKPELQLFILLWRRILIFAQVSLLFLLCSCHTNYAGALMASCSENEAIVTTECSSLADGRALIPVYRVGDKFYVKAERAMLKKRVTPLVPLDEDLLSEQFLESSDCWVIQGPAFEYLYSDGDEGYYEVSLSLYDEDYSPHRIKTRHGDKTYTSIANIKCIITRRNEKALSDLPPRSRVPIGTGIIDGYRVFSECDANGTIQRVYDPRPSMTSTWKKICIFPFASVLFLVETAHIIVMYPIYMTVQGE